MNYIMRIPDLLYNSATSTSILGVSTWLEYNLKEHEKEQRLKPRQVLFASPLLYSGVKNVTNIRITMMEGLPEKYKPRN